MLTGRDRLLAGLFALQLLAATVFGLVVVDGLDGQTTSQVVTAGPGQPGLPTGSPSAGSTGTEGTQGTAGTEGTAGTAGGGATTGTTTTTTGGGGGGGTAAVVRPASRSGSERSSRRPVPSTSPPAPRAPRPTSTG